MTTRARWLLGLQWGACAWLGYINLLTCTNRVQFYLLSSTGRGLPDWMWRWIGEDHGLLQAAA